MIIRLLRIKINPRIFGNRKIVISIESNGTDNDTVSNALLNHVQNPVTTTGTDTSPKVSAHVQK